MFPPLICVFTLDRIGRRWTLYWGAVGQGIAMFLAGAFSKLGMQATADGDLSKANSYGAAAASFVFIFTSVFGATWLTVPWLYPAEIFPLQVRAKGNAWGVVGWSIGNGWLTLLCPVMFNAIGKNTLHIFGACNVLAIRRRLGPITGEQPAHPRGDRPAVRRAHPLGLGCRGHVQTAQRRAARTRRRGAQSLEGRGSRGGRPEESAP